MTQYARPNNDDDNPTGGGVDSWVNASMSTSNIYASIDESSTSDSDYIRQSNGMGSRSWYKAGLGDTVTDPVTELDDHKIKFRAVANDASMAGIPTLTVALYDTTADTPLIVTDDFNQSNGLEDEGMMGGGTWADFTISLDSTQAGNIVSYDDLQIWFKMSSSMGMGDYVKVSQAWFECADVPEEEEAAATSPAFLLFAGM